MSDSLTNLTDTFLVFYRQYVLQVFRYHLLRSGDWQDAEAMTAETFRRAQGWFSQRESGSAEGKTWLFRMAVALYSRFRRPPGFYRGDDAQPSPTQEQLSQFARTTEVYDLWRRLPRKEQDARALYLFAGLEVDEVAAVTGWKLLETVERVGRMLADQGEMRLLAGQIQPVGYFIGHLENELRERAEQLRGRRSRLPGMKLMWLRYRIGPILTLLGQALPLVVLGGMLLWVVNFYTLQTTPAEVSQDPTSPARRPRATNSGRIDFPASQDTGLVVSAQGGVFAYHLSNGEFVRLSEDGFMPAHGLNPDFPPQVSPDGTWLALVSHKDGSTWLFSLNGAERRQISASSLHLTWAPGGSEAVYPLPDDPQVLYQYSSAAIYNRELARLPGDIKALAWSPDGRWIGVVYQSPGESQDMVHTTLAVLNSRGLARMVLSSREEHVGDPDDGSSEGSQRLLWTEDSSELWYPRWNAGVNLAQAMATKLNTLQPSVQVAQDLEVILMPLVAQPFSNRYGIQSELLYGPDTYGKPPLMRYVAVSSDRRQIALLLANPNGVVGSVAVQDSANLDQNRWIRSFGRIGKISWTGESGSLLAGEFVDEPGELLRINARNGRSMVVGEGYWLLGTVSEMRYEAGNRAPQAEKIPLSGPDLSGPTVRVDHPGLGVSLEAPAHFRVWQLSVVDPNGLLMITNFDLGDPLGYVSLSEDDILIAVVRAAPPGEVVGASLAANALGNSETFELHPFTQDGRNGFRVIYHPPDNVSYEQIYIEDPAGPLLLYYLPANTSKQALFERMVASLKLAPPKTPTPTPQPSPTPTPTVEVAWNDYSSPGLGLAFDLPTTYLQDPVCGARATGELVLVGSQIYITSDRLAGRALGDYMDERLTESDEELHIASRESFTFQGGEAITVEGSLGVSGFFSRTVVRSGEKVWMISLTPRESCDHFNPAVSDLQVYRRMLASLRVQQ